MTNANYCDRHVDGTVMLYIPVGGDGPFIVDSVYNHRPRGFYESIQCLSCRFEQEHNDKSRQYFRLTPKILSKKRLTAKERLQKLLRTRKEGKD